MKRLFRKLHLWLSVPFGIVITLICFSGAMLVFEKEVMQFTHRSLYYVDEVHGVPLPIGQLVDNANASLDDGVEITGVTIYSDSSRTYQFSLSQPRKATLSIDQYTGEVKGVVQRTPFFSAMFGLHRWLLCSRPSDGGIFWGKIVVGVSTLLFVIVLVTGILIWWPRNAKGLKNSLKIKLNNGWHRLWHGLHVAGGVYALLLLLVMALTGLTWSFGWYRTAFYGIFGVETQSHGRGGQQRSVQQGSNDDYEVWQNVYEQLATSNPCSASITVGNGTASVSNNRYGNTRGSDRYIFDGVTGEITQSIEYNRQPQSGKVRGWVYSVHTGTFGGIATRLLWFVASLLGATLPLTGYYLWIRRLYRRRRQ